MFTGVIDLSLPEKIMAIFSTKNPAKAKELNDEAKTLIDNKDLRVNGDNELRQRLTTRGKM